MYVIEECIGSYILSGTLNVTTLRFSTPSTVFFIINLFKINKTKLIVCSVLYSHKKAQKTVQQVIIEGGRTVTVIVWPMVALITEAAIDTVLLTTPLILGTVQLFTWVRLICEKRDAREKKPKPNQ